jgi:hypothetical protein
MNAAQACSNRRYTWHHAPEESQAAADAGYPFLVSAKNRAQTENITSGSTDLLLKYCVTENKE